MFTYSDCNDAWPQTIRLIERAGVAGNSRNGRVKFYPEPVTFAYTHPQRRVLFCDKRNINPYLHFFEPLWILAGRRDVEFLSNIVSRFAEYSDDGKTFNAAYGYRLRFPEDQISEAIARLRKNPDDRQIVLQIRRPDDIMYTGKDTACNLCVAVNIIGGKLNIHVFNRSNDVVWGGPAGGANFPQFTTLQEYLAGRIGCDVGKYYHTTNNMHAYIDTPDWEKISDNKVPYADSIYATNELNVFPLFEGIRNQPDDFDTDLYNFFASRGEEPSYTPFFRDVVKPMWRSFNRFKAGEKHCYELIEAEDWDRYLRQWLLRKNRV